MFSKLCLGGAEAKRVRNELQYSNPKGPPMTNSTLQKVARAIKDTGLLEYDDTDTLMQLARAALNALRQVDDETVEAMARVFHVAGWLPNPKAEYQHLRDAITAAIDHILTEGGER